MKTINKVNMAIIQANSEADLTLLNMAEALLFGDIISLNSDNEQCQQNAIDIDKLADDTTVQYDI